jgi:hypothetical protein
VGLGRGRQLLSGRSRAPWLPAGGRQALLPALLAACLGWVGAMLAALPPHRPSAPPTPTPLAESGADDGLNSLYFGVLCCEDGEALSPMLSRALSSMLSCALPSMRALEAWPPPPPPPCKRDGPAGVRREARGEKGGGEGAACSACRTPHQQPGRRQPWAQVAACATAHPAPLASLCHNAAAAALPHQPGLGQRQGRGGRPRRGQGRAGRRRLPAQRGPHRGRLAPAVVHPHPPHPPLVRHRSPRGTEGPQAGPAAGQARALPVHASWLCAGSCPGRPVCPWRGPFLLLAACSAGSYVHPTRSTCLCCCTALQRRVWAGVPRHLARRQRGGEDTVHVGRPGPGNLCHPSAAGSAAEVRGGWLVQPGLTCQFSRLGQRKHRQRCSENAAGARCPPRLAEACNQGAPRNYKAARSQQRGCPAALAGTALRRSAWCADHWCDAKGCLMLGT